MMSRNFSQAPLMELVPSFLQKAENLCKQLDKPGTVNVYPWIHRLGMEFISKCHVKIPQHLGLRVTFSTGTQLCKFLAMIPR
jgi:hypothetical protein